MGIRCLFGHEPYYIFSFNLSSPMGGYTIATCSRCSKPYHLHTPRPNTDEVVAEWIKNKYPNAQHYKWGDFRRKPYAWYGTGPRVPSLKVRIIKESVNSYRLQIVCKELNSSSTGYVDAILAEHGGFPAAFCAHYAFQQICRGGDPHQSDYIIECVNFTPNSQDLCSSNHPVNTIVAWWNSDIINKYIKNDGRDLDLR